MPVLSFCCLNHSLKTKKNPESSSPKLNILSGLLGKGQFSTTIFLWTATFGTLLVMYLLLGWMPSLLVAMGLSQSQAQYVQMLYNIGSSIGAAAGGYLLDRKLLYSTPGTAYVGLAAFLAVFGFLALDFGTALMVAFGVGAMVTVAQATLYTHLRLSVTSRPFGIQESVQRLPRDVSAQLPDRYWPVHCSAPARLPQMF